MREQLLLLLAQGVDRTEALRLVGCSDDYISECIKDPVFIQELREARDKQRAELIEQGYAKLELATQTQIKKEVDTGMVEVADLCRILETTAKNRVLMRTPSNHFTNPTAHLTVELRMPAGVAVERIIMDDKTNQIVAIGDRNMSGLPIAGVQKLFKSFEDEKLAEKARQTQEERAIIDADIMDIGKENTDAHVPSTNSTNQDYETRPIARVA